MDPRTMLTDITARVASGERMKFVFFWTHVPKRPGSVGPWVLSQWFPAPFHVDGDDYATAEHFMMAEKARLFHDFTVREAILSTDDPGKAKALGRQVRGFDNEVWATHRFDIVVSGNLAKFAAHPNLHDYLRATHERVLVEASPRDRIWGIGMGASNDDAANPGAWRGLNLLGFALMVARDRLRAEE